jgi:DNA-binding response OmpR family regulator
MARILIIDDDPGLRAVLTAVLEDNHEVIIARDGVEGVELAKAKSPDLAVVDVDMPGMNGYQVCVYLRGFPPTRALPILMLTGMTKLPDAMKGMATGANDYLTKPFDIHEVLARVEALLKLSSGPPPSA